MLHVVGRRVDIAIGERWGLTPALSRIVVIGARDGLDEDLLTETLTGCLSGMVP